MIASNTTIPDPVAWYSSHAAALAPTYEAIDPAKGYAWLAELMPTAPALVLDVGAGTGRDAAWLSWDTT
jgi:protein-L-isoaspartate O-methyltransferase